MKARDFDSTESLSENPLGRHPGTHTGVPRFVIPAKAGIQPGFRLALRLAGMTRVPADLSAPRQLGFKTPLKVR